MFVPPICIPPSFHLLPPPSSLSCKNLSCLLGQLLRNCNPPFSLPGVEEIVYMDENFLRPVPETCPLDGLVVAVLTYLFLLQDILLFLWIVIWNVYVF